MIEIIAVRHGETDWNRIRRLQGHTDIPLNETGVAQAARVGAALAGEAITAIHSSDLGRAVETARPIATALRLPVTPHALLRERNYGVLEGRTFPQIVDDYPLEAEQLRLRNATHTIEGGESQATFRRRVVDAVTAIVETEREAATARGEADIKLLIVTHGGVLDMLYRTANAIALDAERMCPIPNAVVNRLRYVDGRFAVRSWAEEP